MDMLDRAYAEELLNAVASGYKSSTVTDNLDGSKTLTIEFTSGDKANITFNPVKGDDGLSIKDAKIKTIDGVSYLYFVLEDDTETTPIELSIIEYSEPYKEEITTISDTWNVQHNLNTPWDELTIQIVDSDGNITNGDIDKDNCTDNLLIIKFREPIVGKITIKK